MVGFKYNVGLKTLLLEGLSEPEFYGDLVYKFRKIIGKNDVPYHFKKIIVRYKKIGYNIDVLRQTACLVVNPNKVNSLNVRLACDHLFGKLLFTWLSLVMSMMVSFVLSFFPRDVLDEILNLIESVSEDFPSYSCLPL